MDTLDPGEREEAQAAARYASLPVAQQMAMARKLAQEHGAALKLAHEGLTTVAAGYRAQRDVNGRAMVYPEPCVILGVRQKWDSPQAGPPAQRLPRLLILHRAHNGKPEPYAVPTDVQPADWFHGAVARTSGSVWVDEPQSHGTLTCAVQLRTAAGTQHLALSAMHVLSPWTHMDLAAPGGDVVERAGAGAVGITASWSGALRQDADSFDAQLADIANPQWFNTAFSQWALPAVTPYVRSPEEFDALTETQSLRILAPDNHPAFPGRGPMVAQFRSYAGSDVPITYKVRLGGVRMRMYVHHSQLVQLEVTRTSPAPAEGDSGSAVLIWRLDGTLALAGMFIASLQCDAGRVAYMLPAWELFKLANWVSLPVGTTRMTPRFSFP